MFREESDERSGSFRFLFLHFSFQNEYVEISAHLQPFQKHFPDRFFLCFYNLLQTVTPLYQLLQLRHRKRHGIVGLCAGCVKVRSPGTFAIGRLQSSEQD